MWVDDRRRLHRRELDYRRCRRDRERRTEFGLEPTVSLTTTRSNSWVFMVGTDWDAIRELTPAAGQTMVNVYNPPAKDTR
jgi:hypothetical protein